MASLATAITSIIGIYRPYYRSTLTLSSRRLLVFSDFPAAWRLGRRGPSRPKNRHCSRFSVVVQITEGLATDGYYQGGKIQEGQRLDVQNMGLQVADKFDGLRCSAGFPRASLHG